MNMINESVRGISLIVNLNQDRLIMVAILCAALAAGAYFSHP